MTAVHFSAETVEWATPRRLFLELDHEWHFEVDVCSTHENAKCAKHWTRLENGLLQDWVPLRCWMNPPYGRAIGAWVEKAFMSASAGAVVVALLPARTDTKWWHAWVEPVLRGRVPGSVRFLEGRLRFGGAKAGAPFPSVVVVFGERQRSLVSHRVPLQQCLHAPAEVRV